MVPAGWWLMAVRGMRYEVILSVNISARVRFEIPSLRDLIDPDLGRMLFRG